MNRRHFLQVVAATTAAIPGAMVAWRAEVVEAAVEPAKPQPTSLQVYSAPPNSDYSDPLSMTGFVAYKIRCRECSRVWGEWQKISEDVVRIGFPWPTEQDLADKALAVLQQQRFKLDSEGYFTCPQCQGRLERPAELLEGVVPLTTTWYVTEWRPPQPVRFSYETVTEVRF